MNNQRPLSNRKFVQLMLALTILAWATQTLFHQWGYGQEAQFVAPEDQEAGDAPTDAPATRGSEKFVPDGHVASQMARGTLVLRADATVPDTQIKLKNICRWS